MDHPGHLGHILSWPSGSHPLTEYTEQIMCINYGGTCLLPPSLNKQVTVYKFSIEIGFSREVVFLYWWPLRQVVLIECTY